jgi:phosphonatase-like hydrolase
MTEVRMVVFDIAGTTVEEGNVVYKTLHRAISDAGAAVTLHEVMESGAGKEKLQSIRDVMAHSGKGDPETAESIHRSFLEMLDKAYADFDIKAQPGAEEVFEELRRRGIHVVLNTGYGEETARSLLDRLGWKEGREFDLLVTASQVRKSRPEPDMIDLARERLAVRDPRSVVKVGDVTFDIEEGRKAGCGLAVAVTTGAHSREQLARSRPDHVIDSLRELLPLI